MFKIKWIIISGFIVTGLLWASCNQETRIVCVGDSITEGAGLANHNYTAYPAVLGRILGDSYAVLNSGRSATTLSLKGDFPYRTCKEFTNTFVFKPDIIIIALGTNDTKPYNWNAENFEHDYRALIDTFKTMDTNPDIILCIPVPVFKTTWAINDSTLTNGVIPVIEKLAAEYKLPLIDLYAGLKSDGALFPDNIHPDANGAEKIAQLVANNILK